MGRSRHDEWTTLSTTALDSRDVCRTGATGACAEASVVSEFQDRIGPRAADGDRLWFGKTFYDGEGVEGVGGLGYFDAATSRFEILTSPLIADWSVTAIHVEPEHIWLALASSRRVRGPQRRRCSASIVATRRSTRSLIRAASAGSSCASAASCCSSPTWA